MPPLISIIIPVYNVEKYLDKCINSVLMQTYKNIEILLINDGSTDSSGQICESYAKKDSRIKVIHKENGGLSDARNVGIEHSTGSFIMFVDSDDYIDCNMASVLYNLLNSTNSDMAICNCTKVDEEYNMLTTPSSVTDEIILGKKALDKLNAPFSWIFIVACNKLYKKEIFDNLKFPVGRVHEDEFVIHRIFCKCNKIVCTSKPLYYYLQRNTSITHVYSLKRVDAINALKDRLDFAKENNLNKLYAYTLWKLVNRSLTNINNILKFFPEEKILLNKLSKDLFVYYFKAIKNIFLPFKSKISLTFKILKNIKPIWRSLYGK